ncbi:MAG TPA: hypothetical protein VH682_07355 [Gemmataceae bacterium]|jgi:hypothetical protein
MRSIAVSLLALGFCATVDGDSFFSGRARAGADENKAKGHKAADKEKKPKPRFTVGKETTYVAGPLDEDGTIDYSVPLNERLRKGVTPDNNAVVLLWKALGPRPEGKEMSAEFYKWLGIDAPPAKGDYFLGQDRYAKEHLKIEPGPALGAYADEIGRAAQRPWTAKQYPRVAEWLSVNEKPLTLVLEATKRPQYFSPLVPTRSKKGSSGILGALMPGVQKCRELAQAFTVRAMLAIAEGRLDDAWRDLLACHRLGRLVARGAIFIEVLVGMAIDTIASNADVALLERAGTDAKVDAKQIRSWLRDLQRLPPMPDMAEKIDLGQRFMGLDCFMLIARGDGPETPEAITGGAPPKDANPHALDVIDWDPALRLANRCYDRMATTMRIKDRAEREKQLNRLTKELDEMVKKGRRSGVLGELWFAFTITPQKMGEQIGQIGMALLLPAIHKVQQAYERSEQIEHNLHVAFALACYHREHGRYPDKLETLTPAYLENVPQDIFSGEALIYRPTAKGFLLYSIGVNGRDDEGRGYGDDPPADDLNVRMPLPALRRK